MLIRTALQLKNLSVIPIFLCPSMPDSPRARYTIKIKWHRGSGPQSCSQSPRIGALFVYKVPGGDFPGAWYPPLQSYKRGYRGYSLEQYQGAELHWIRDGLSKTVLLAETSNRVEYCPGWISNYDTYSGGPPYKPSPLVAAPITQQGNDTLASHHPGGAHVSMCDGAVRFVDVETSQETLVQFYSRNQNDAPISYD